MLPLTLQFSNQCATWNPENVPCKLLSVLCKSFIWKKYYNTNFNCKISHIPFLPRATYHMFDCLEFICVQNVMHYFPIDRLTHSTETLFSFYFSFLLILYDQFSCLPFRDCCSSEVVHVKCNVSSYRSLWTTVQGIIQKLVALPHTFKDPYKLIKIADTNVLNWILNY